jgi:heptaprenylglyceryl phosphate synthase
VDNLEVLRTMKTYQEYFYSQEFYARSRMYLEACGFFPKSLPKEHVAVMKKIQAVYFLDMYYKEK